jgi:hypothetical protein
LLTYLSYRRWLPSGVDARIDIKQNKKKTKMKMKMISKSIMSIFVAGALGVGLSSQQAQAIVLDFSSDIGSSIRFNGNTDSFMFNQGLSGYDFMVTLAHDGFGDSLGLKGNISGDFTIGSISSNGPTQSAPVTSVGGVISIFDGTTSLTADIAWIDIFTNGTIGGLNAGGTVNVTNFSYGGSNNDLTSLATLGMGSGIAALSFQFVPSQSLTTLTANGTTTSTSYSGSIGNSAATSVPDGGSTLALLGGALFGAAGLRRKFKKA